MKVSQETGSEATTGYERAMMHSCLAMHPPKAAFLSFWIKPKTVFFQFCQNCQNLQCMLGSFGHHITI